MLAKQLENEEIYEVPQAPVRPAIHRPLKVRPHSCLNTHLRSRCLLLVGLLAVMGMALTTCSSMGASRGYELVQAQQAAVRLEQQNEQLRIEIARLKSPQRFQSIATKDLGMVVPKQVYFASDKHE